MANLSTIVGPHWHAAPGTFELALDAIRGGLESAVVRARVTHATGPTRVPHRFVIKQLPLGRHREADVYALLWAHLPHPPTARLLGRLQVGARTYLLLEDVRSGTSWPWYDTAASSLVCRELARFHTTATLPPEPFAWNYEAELCRSAEETLAVAMAARDRADRPYWARRGDLRRVVEALPWIRAQLRARPTTVIHGDMHPGNVLLRTTNGVQEMVLIDWGRARLGSPLEDVASWLHSLGCWEPQARRQHDTLMRAYLDARGDLGSFTQSLRVEYWLASVSNGLAGAIRFHLSVLLTRRSSAGARYDSGRALAAWQRVVRRASSIVRTRSYRRRT